MHEGEALGQQLTDEQDLLHEDLLWMQSTRGQHDTANLVDQELRKLKQS